MKKLNTRKIRSNFLANSFTNSFINPFITFLLLLILSTSSIYCNDLYKSLCTPSVLQIKELIKHSFTISNKNLTEFDRWTYRMNLKEFCKSNGFDNNKLPNLIKVSKLSKQSSERDDKVSILLTIKVPITKFFVDEDDKTSYKYWLLHKWPYEPFFCSSCRSFLTYSTKKHKNVNNKMTFTYGVMQNKYPSLVDPENFESIKREVKKKFNKEEFDFLANSTNNELIRGLDYRPKNQNDGDNKDPEKNVTVPVDENPNSPNEKVNNATKMNLNSNETTTTIEAWTTISSLINTTMITIDNQTLTTDNVTTDNVTTDNVTIIPDFDPDIIKKSVYVNLSTFVGSNKYFLVGMNLLNLDGIFSQLTLNKSMNSSLLRSKRAAGELLSIKEDEFYLEYSLCYNSIASVYLPTFNCFPLFVDDQLKNTDNGKSMAIADCVCWNPHFYKSIIFYQLLLILVFIGLTLVFCNKWNRRKITKQNLASSRYNYTQTPGQVLGPQTKIVVYQIILQIHIPNDGKPKLPGRLNVKLFTNLNQPFYEINFTSANKFCHPFLFNDDILKTTSYIYSDTAISDVKKLVVEFEANNGAFIYLYGIVITNGLNTAFTFPYSNYLANRTEVHLSERSVWMNYISRHENLIPLSDILPICNPQCIRLSKIEKLLLIVIFSSKFASNALQSRDLEDVHWSVVFFIDFTTNVLVYVLIFTLHIIYAKPLLNREYFFIKLNLEYIEIKFLIFISSIFIFNSPISTIYEINMNLWKDKLTIDSLRDFDKVLLQNDLIWALNFFGYVSLFLIFTHFFETYFYKLRKRQSLSSGPSNSLADRLMTN